jgi:ParB family chromosome partitioning protein
VPLDRLVPDPDQPRKTMPEEGLRELADSLLAQGMRQPITAYYDDSRERFVVVSGERRLRAAQRAGMSHVPVLVERRPASETDKLVLQLAENLVREDLTAPEAARALGRLKELRPKDWLEVAARHGFGRRRAYQYLDLLDDPAPLRQAVEQGAIAAGHAEELRRVAPERLPHLLDEVVVHGLSVADTRRLIAADKVQEQAQRSARQGLQATPTAATADPAPATDAQRAPSTRRGPTAGAVADSIQAATQTVPPVPSPAPSGAALVEEKERRKRARHLRGRLERISSELRNMHLEDVAAELPQLPEIIVQARQARDHLDALIALLERVQLDRAGEADDAPR